MEEWSVWGGGKIYLCAGFEGCQKTFNVNKFVQYTKLTMAARIYNLIINDGEEGGT